MSDTEELLIGVGVFVIMVFVPLIIAITTDFRKKK
jgi:hypothetical protein